MSWGLGNPISRIPDESEKTVYLTFDDGPERGSTDQVLRLLEREKVSATFFVVGERAKQERGLISEIRSGSHRIGNHSWDHRYLPYFQGTRTLIDWIRRTEETLQEILHEPSVGFRPPAGVRTPELTRALLRLQMPLVLWDIRFYDAMFRWTRRKAAGTLSKIKPGTIVLLHDRQRAKNFPLFLETLGFYIEALKKNGFVLRPLTRELCIRARDGRKDVS